MSTEITKTLKSEALQAKFVEVVKKDKSPLLWEKEQSFAMQAIQGLPALQKCTPSSIQTAVVNVALTGLSLNPKLAYCYLVPRGGKAILDISYQGMIYLMTSKLNIKSLHTDVVHKNDYFEMETTEEGVKLTHKPDPFSTDRGPVIGVYAIAYNKGGGSTVAVLNNEEIEAIKKTSSAAGTSFSPWSSKDETIVNEMRKKTAIRRLWKLVPKTDRIDQLAESIRVQDEQHEAKFTKHQESEPINDFAAFEEAEVVEEKQENTK